MQHSDATLNNSKLKLLPRVLVHVHWRFLSERTVRIESLWRSLAPKTMELTTYNQEVSSGGIYLWQLHQGGLMSHSPNLDATRNKGGPKSPKRSWYWDYGRCWKSSHDQVCSGSRTDTATFERPSWPFGMDSGLLLHLLFCWWEYTSKNWDLFWEAVITASATFVSCSLP